MTPKSLTRCRLTKRQALRRRSRRGNRRRIVPMRRLEVSDAVEGCRADVDDARVEHIEPDQHVVFEEVVLRHAIELEAGQSRRGDRREPALRVEDVPVAAGDLGQERQQGRCQTSAARAYRLAGQCGESGCLWRTRPCPVRWVAGAPVTPQRPSDRRRPSSRPRRTLLATRRHIPSTGTADSPVHLMVKNLDACIAKALRHRQRAVDAGVVDDFDRNRDAIGRPDQRHDRLHDLLAVVVAGEHADRGLLAADGTHRCRGT